VEGAPRLAGDPATRHGHAQIKPPVALLMPAQVLAHLEARHRARVLERLAQILLEARLCPGLAMLGDHVFEPRVPAVGPVAVIPVKPHDGLGSRQEILGCHESNQ
jgi:hypothetical protein